MKKIAILVVLCIGCSAPSHARNNSASFNESISRLVGEVSFLNLKAEYGKVQVAKISLIGVGHYFQTFGVGAYLARYNSVLNDGKGYIREYEITEILPVRISYVPFFATGSYNSKSFSSQNEPFLFWNSVTPGQYAKFYTRFFAEASLIKYLSCLNRDPYLIVNPDGSITNRFRTIGKMYPPTLTAGIQISYTILSLETGYTYQTERWYEFYKHGLAWNPEGFSFSGPYISVNITLGAILTRTGSK
jgi:hypothetical protein